MEQIPGVKIQSGPLPGPSTTEREAIADEKQSEDESSEADSDQARKQISRSTEGLHAQGSDCLGILSQEAHTA